MDKDLYVEELLELPFSEMETYYEIPIMGGVLDIKIYENKKCGVCKKVTDCIGTYDIRDGLICLKCFLLEGKGSIFRKKKPSNPFTINKIPIIT